jgi:hypothetical protein
MNPMCLTENSCGEENKKRLTQISFSPIDKTTHDIVNQLSIICLCCCELRQSLAEKLLPDHLNQLGRIETAVKESARLIEKLKTGLQGHEPIAKKPASILTRVEPTDSLYPIASHSALRR